MRRFAGPLVVVPLVVVGLALPVAAQPAYRHTFSLGAWFGSARASEDPGPTVSTWSSTIWNLDYRARSLSSPWGFRLHYATGARESFWSADVSFGVPSLTPSPGASLDLRPFVGYGSFSTSTPITARVTSTGFRLGINADYPLSLVTGRDVKLTATFAWHPSNTVTSPSGTTRGTAFESTVAVQFKLPWMRTMGPGQAGYYLTSLLQDGFDPSWSGRAGWNFLGLTGSSYQWTGPFVEIFKTF